MNTLIRLENIWANYGKRDVLQQVSLEIEKNDFLGVIGPNGGGKTTLMRIILGLLKPERGSIHFFQEGHLIKQIIMGYLPQYNQTDKKFPISVEEVILSGLSHKKNIFSRYTSEDYRQVAETIQQLELVGLEKRPIGQLSGGQLQRVLLARAIVSHPKALILDEPNTYLDRTGEQQLYDSLQKINENCAIILVSHDLNAIEHYAKRIAYVNVTLEMINKTKEKA